MGTSFGEGTSSVVVAEQSTLKLARDRVAKGGPPQRVKLPKL
jgi:hypothetical protein